jgi:flavin reductase (DIM6/NTAB) family NADH-FMN oxidoreductase RutF
MLAVTIGPGLLFHPMTPDHDQLASLDRFVDGLDYPVFVVTAADAESRAGCLVGFASQVSIDPPRLLICLSVNNATFRTAPGSRALGVHLLGADQRKLAELFGAQTGDEIDKFARCRWEPGPLGVPILSDAQRWLVARIVRQLDLGDHHGFVVEPYRTSPGVDSPVVDAPVVDASVLTYRDVKDLDPGHGA